jgi:mono/diheme cytochrome c family protein
MTLLTTAPASAGGWGALVMEGERWWSRSPDPARPVACATCHHDPEAIRGWAASFPKVRPMPPPHTRVMTLLQANAEAVARHYGLKDPQPAAVALTAFLTAQGAGRPTSPGTTPDQPVFPARMRALAASVERGRQLYGQRCRTCHGSAAIGPASGSFRRGTTEPVELFLEGHRPAGRPIPWHSRAMADLVAYLLAPRVGEPVRVEGPPGALEDSR